MASFSVIVTAHNNAPVLARTLQSVETALAFHQAQTPSFPPAGAEVVVVDDGSTDATAQVIREVTLGKGLYKIIRRDRPSSPACARNVGVASSSGELLFFLDGDDLFLPAHIHTCCWALEDPAAAFVKTGVRLADPVHPDWKVRITHSVVINLCLRRHCHFAVGGFPDFHLFTRQGDAFALVLAIFYKIEDMFYNELVCALFRGVGVTAETVEHLRYPGNTFDRQSAKFCRPFGDYEEGLPAERRFQLQLADVIFRHQVETLRARKGR
jgi:glycosyltransferase involved in cell wall biosynthesis